MKKIRLNFEQLIPQVLQVDKEPPPPEKSAMIAKLRPLYPHVFQSISGTILHHEVNLQLKEGITPVFRGPRVVSIPLRGPTEAALQKLVAEGKLEKCSPGPWGTPIVPVLKSNKEVRVCDDYSITLNPGLNITGRRTPLIDDLSTVEGGWFCLVDMNQAYLQLKLSQTSQELCKINTPFGSFRWTHMPNGISAGPAIFQEVISSILAGIEKTFIYLVDVLIWDTTQEGRERRLHQVLKRLEEHHVTLNVSKSRFLVPSVTYLGFLLDRHGLRADPSRMDELLKKPSPRTFPELKSFIGMITFYHKCGEALSTVLHPLYELQKTSTWTWGREEEAAFRKALTLVNDSIFPSNTHKDDVIWTSRSGFGHTKLPK